MFTFFCTTCETKLVVKDEKLIGKIVACPQCDSMVLVQSAEDAPEPIPSGAKQTTHKRFPDVLTHETASGIIGHTSKEYLRTEVFLETVPPDPNAIATEIKTRKLLLGILIGLSASLLVALGFLIVFQRPTAQPLAPLPQPIPQDQRELPPEEPAPPEPVKDIEIVLPPIEEPPEILQQDTITESERIDDEPDRIADDLLSAIEKRMPGFVDTSVPNIDIDVKLALPILEWNLNQQRLIELIRVISQLTGVPMTLDIDEMKPRSLSVNTPVAGQFSETTAGEILTKTLAALELQWIAMDRQILIYPKETADKIDLTFDVSDFAERTDDLTPKVLAEMVRKLVCPENNVTVLPDNRLSVAQDEKHGKSPMRQRDDIRRFLEQLRAVRQLPQKTELTGETLAPEAFGWDRVMESMTLNHYRAVPLSRILTQLETQTDLTIIVDHQSFHRALCLFASVYATVQCDQGTVHDVLELSLASADLAAVTYRIVDHHTLEITTMESARQPEKMVMEVHRYELRADETPEDIVRSLRSAVAPDSWAVSELPETRYGGSIVVDRPSACLFVRQSQPAQRQIRLFLSTPEP